MLEHRVPPSSRCSTSRSRFSPALRLSSGRCRQSSAIQQQQVELARWASSVPDSTTIVRCRTEEEGIQLVLALCERQGMDRFEVLMFFGLIPASGLALLLLALVLIG